MKVQRSKYVTQHIITVDCSGYLLSLNYEVWWGILHPQNCVKLILQNEVRIYHCQIILFIHINDVVGPLI
jgi:hypothetical protein